MQYIHVKWKNGADDMVPEHSAHLLADAGDLTIVDPTPSRHHRFKARVPLGTKASNTATRRVATEPAPTGATTAEEATE